MTELVLMKTPSGALAPADPQAAEFIAKLKAGAGVLAVCKKVRNPRFHRKAFVLFHFAFELWDAPALEYKGQPVAKDFTRFRKDLTILAGHYTAVTNILGETRLEAKSLAWGNMEEAEFQEVYKSVLNAVWKRVLSSHGYDTPAAVDRVINRLLSFD